MSIYQIKRNSRKHRQVARVDLLVKIHERKEMKDVLLAGGSERFTIEMASHNGVIAASFNPLEAEMLRREIEEWLFSRKEVATA